MFDSAALSSHETAPPPPADVLARFSEFARMVRTRTILTWGEHCTECAFPGCYSSCQFYTPRIDMHCRRFEEGIVALAAGDVRLMRITFKRWGKLEAIGSKAATDAPAANQLESRHLAWS